jgi:5-methylcytosine-specific restriction endonuclease McrA
MIFDRAADLLLEKLQKQRLGKTERPRKSKGKEDGISNAVRRAVFERDGERCTFESKGGERCPATTFLELDHVDARAKGGADTVENLRVRCRPHNKLHAEKTFGREHVEERIHFRYR